MKRFEESFNSKLAGLDFEALENSAHSIFGLSKDLKLNYLNPGWFRFARQNEGEPDISRCYPIGTPIEEAIAGDICDFYIENYLKTLRDLKVWKHEYECSSPDLFRIYSQDTYPLKDGEGLIVVNSLKVEKTFDKTWQGSPVVSLKAYHGKNGLITQCSNCRKVQRASETEIWDWVPELVARMPDNVSHSICPICYDYYWAVDIVGAKEKASPAPVIG
jgi:hypothetical protein